MQRDLIQNIFALEDRTAEELMTPRRSLEALSVSAAPEEVTRRIAGSPRSRYPVFEDNLDEIIGVLHVKDFIRARVAGRSLHLGRLIRPLPSVAASSTAEHLLALFKRERLHAALVVDEFGGTLGFVTMDDLIEDVMDEEDAGSSDWVQRNEDGSLSLNGEVTLSELREDHGLNLHSEDATTIAGLLLGSTGRCLRRGPRCSCRVMTSRLKRYRASRSRASGYGQFRLPPAVLHWLRGMRHGGRVRAAAGHQDQASRFSSSACCT
ncbi:CBS domain-containing protein [Deinococcus malanensis]|uniref:CBS domain-containing protein n=1 Tax=Deinococcus malanensis TaxID=1706855 RepID=UPI00363E7956